MVGKSLMTGNDMVSIYVHKNTKQYTSTHVFRQVGTLRIDIIPAEKNKNTL